MSDIERRLRKIEASLEWMINSDNVLTEELDELGDRIEQLESTITTAGWMKYVEDRVDRLEVTGADLQPDSDGWIPWHGGKCPVDPEVIVEFKMRNLSGGSPAEAKLLRWPHENTDDDIIAYRPAKQEAEWPQKGDRYWFIRSDGVPEIDSWNGSLVDYGRQEYSGAYRTHQAAEEAAGKIRRVMEHWRKGMTVVLVDAYPPERIKL